MTSFSELQRKVHVGKDKKNEFGGYSYRTAEGILAAIKAALPEGAYVTLTEDITEVAGQIFVKSTATIYVPDEAEYTATGYAMHPITKKGMDPSQITGAASSYARKYALAGLMALDDGSVDPDAAKEPYQEELPQVVLDAVSGVLDMDGLAKVWTGNKQWQTHPDFQKAKDKRKAELEREAA
ncbi:MAG: hypothetical protein CML68_13695 [Rhodobacteraceae bacterium]|nr:hypothetical protein [Paracoccaceae bacterium]